MVYWHALWNLPTKVTFFFYLIYLFKYNFKRILSYFAKPNFIVYDEWFDEDLEINNHDSKNKKIKKISKIHDFFYEQSNYKVGASENNLQLDIKINEKELITNNYLEKSLEKYTSARHKKFSLMNKMSKSKLKFSITKKINLFFIHF